MWRLVPFYLAIISAPLLFGGVKPESQAVLGILLALGLILINSKRALAPVLPAWIKVTLISLLLLPLIPLPMQVIQFLSPERARLAMEFPIDGRVPEWLTLSTSPARSVQRLWELVLAGTALVLARHNAALPGGKRRIAITLSVALILLAAADIWSSQHGRQTVLGLWSISWGKGYGTFANHNHFANWIFVASLFCAGWMLRELFRPDRASGRITLVFVACATVFALVMAFLSASRSGTIAFVVGLVAFAMLLRARFQRQSFALIASLAVLALIVVGLLAAEPLLERFRSKSTVTTLALKTEIWKQTARVATEFAMFGAGPGSFVRVYNHYKSAHGDGTFHHAENDFVELPLELGFPFAIVSFALLAVFAFRNRGADSPATAGALAGLVVFFAHACVEFVSHIPANLILAATLLGTLFPSSSIEVPKRKRLFTLGLATAFLVLSVFQFSAWYHFWRAARKPAPMVSLDLKWSFANWPFAVDRRITQLRMASEGISQLPREAQFKLARHTDEEASRALHLDPLNWNLRLEQTWFQLAFTTNTARALSNAWLTVRLNPLQGQIPLRFARHFAARDPDVALQFLEAVHPGIPANHREALGLAWSATRDPAQLWKLTPNTTNSILNLIHFAQEKKLYAIAAQACQTLENRLDAETLARRYMEARRPDQTLRLLLNVDTLYAQSLRIQALHQLNRYTEAIAAGQALFRDSTLRTLFEKKFSPTTSYTQLLTNHQAHPNDPAAALLLAEKAAIMTPQIPQVLSNLAAQFPSEPRIAYLFFQSQTNNAGAASAAAAVIAQRFVSEQH